MTGREVAEKKLEGMLRVAGLPKKASYRPGEVCAILGIVEKTFYNLVNRYEPNPETGQPVNPNSLDSYRMSHHRVRHEELVAYLERNNTYRRNNAADPNQLALFAS